ncbi:MAG: cation diffusion facilitator family transporter [Spirochaetaceae bacterium]|nr:cation diffusion facilitator family transporter [Spirochaetaceae bacterium]
MNTATKAETIKKASIIAITGNLILAAVKIISGVKAGSMAVVADGVDSSVDVLIGIMQIFVSTIIMRPADEDHPWGHGKAETIATVVLSFILFYAGMTLVFNSTHTIIFGEQIESPGFLAIIVTIFSVFGKLLLALTQYILGKKSDSAMLKANGANMASDVIISLGVLAGVGLSSVLKMGVIDAAASGLVGLWVIKTSIGIFWETNTELMDGGSSKAEYKCLFEAVHSVPGAKNPHRARIRRIAGLWDIDLDIEVDGKMALQEAHKIATQVEQAVCARMERVYDIMVHVEPSGDEGKNEGYGLNENTYDKKGGHLK